MMFYVILVSGLGAAVMSFRLRANTERNLARIAAVGALLMALIHWDLW